ncbi:hypothetical protein VNI00_001726 [Paramarasmius palmivorus]|uniref:CCHC-type domain-containing protein n=1 Tax=Paramarasmius palmivorus TaxID=297713 RepID=A0AAW0E3G4_9AGAR
MTRITNFGRKRKYLESSLPHSTPTEDTQQPTAEQSPIEAKEHTDPDPEAPPKKKRKRAGKKRKVDESDKAEGDEKIEGTSTGDKSSKKKKKKEFKNKSKDARLLASESRRLKRIAERDAGTTCFACREKGHSAKYCPKSVDGGQKNVGICYRCGSNRHNLSRCKKPEDPLNPLPFASCFVCKGNGHLASKCPENQDKGVYPNGGCCKMCGEKSHLAKDCDLRKKDNNVLSTIVGIERNIGPDEDDFHIIGRRKQELDREDRRVEKVQRSMDVRVGAQSELRMQVVGEVAKSGDLKSLRCVNRSFCSLVEPLLFKAIKFDSGGDLERSFGMLESLAIDKGRVSRHVRTLDIRCNDNMFLHLHSRARGIYDLRHVEDTEAQQVKMEGMKKTQDQLDNCLPAAIRALSNLTSLR